MKDSADSLMNLNTGAFNCQLIYAGTVRDNPEWKFALHKHDDLHEIIYIEDGEGFFVIDGKEYTARKGDILIYNQGILHQEQSNPEDPLVTYSCGFRFLPPVSEQRDWLIPREREPVIRPNYFSEEFSVLMKALFNEFSLRNRGYQLISQHLLEAILLLLERMIFLQNRTEKEQKASLASEIKEYLDIHYRKKLTLTGLAQLFHIDSYYLVHMFKNNFGIAPISYLIQRRMGEAMRLIATTDKKIWEVAKLVGYDNPNYFSILFTRVIGISPSKFRNSHTPGIYNKE
ncbi:AraC family transcriptional regulator [Paenibacillus sp. MMS20-IR301]|uniref:helix-turn-helix transcriptional regulator n=1 Tax=Paenibacillus sp. MMS20-IR301 TaxID=2895946 RepID=UPI0028EBF25F|nr:AraC family transcriptional regulator [Paenibacillus sp. MMS20-IR301]WNS43365.1 AraC family transcriptional regulator [Paenibacillus sp. MMS20-IR301]